MVLLFATSTNMDEVVFSQVSIWWLLVSFLRLRLKKNYRTTGYQAHQVLTWLPVELQAKNDFTISKCTIPNWTELNCNALILQSDRNWNMRSEKKNLNIGCNNFYFIDRGSLFRVPFYFFFSHYKLKLEEERLCMHRFFLSCCNAPQHTLTNTPFPVYLYAFRILIRSYS